MKGPFSYVADSSCAVTPSGRGATKRLCWQAVTIVWQRKTSSMTSGWAALRNAACRSANSWRRGQSSPSSTASSWGLPYALQRKGAEGSRHLI